MAQQILAGIRVVDFGQGAAIPELGKVLAEFGADVIEVESRHYPDFMRRINPPGRSPNDVDFNPGFNEAHRNKRSLAINMRDPKGQELMREIIKKSDIVMDNNSREIVYKWGVDYESVRKIKPDIIYVQSTGWGGGGPYQNYRSFGGAVAFSGFHWLANYPDEESLVGLNIHHPDHIAGKLLVAPVIAALAYRRRTGKGQFIDVSQLETATALIGEVYLDLAINGRMAVPQGNRTLYAAPHGAYKCKGTVQYADDQSPRDDRWVAIAVTTEEEWQGLCRALGNPAWANSPRFATLVERKRHEDELDELITQWTGQHDAFEAQDTLQARGVPAGVVEVAADHIFRDPQMKHRSFIIEQEHAAAGMGYWPGQPIHMSENPALASRPADPLGARTDEICREILGLSEAQIEALRADGVIGF